MKRMISLILTVLMCVSLVACSEDKVEKKEVELKSSQMKTICELAAIQCYYHNVAKYMHEDATGILWWTKDRKFWVEYSGVVTVGIDASQVTISVDGDIVTITVPPAKVLGCKVDEKTLNKDSFIVAKNSAKVEAQHEIEAFKDAQNKMQEAAGKDTALLLNAQQRAQKLLEDYVNNIGNSIGKTYTIKWVYLEATE